MALKDFFKRNKPAAPTTPDNTIQNNAISEVLSGGGFNNFNSWGQQSNPFAPQISNTNTIFENLRWFLISNYRQPLSEAYVELGLIQTIVDVPVDDALRGGIKILSKQLSEEQLHELSVDIDRDDDLNTAGQAAKWNRLYGGAGILILAGDQDPKEPLDIAAIHKDTDFEIRAVDMWELFWDKQNTEGYDPEIQTHDFEFYNYYSEQVHKSRVMRMTGLTAPSFLRPRLRGWGFSVVEILIRSINQYLKATDLAFACLDEFKVDVYKVKNLVNTLLTPTGQNSVRQRIAFANWQKNYQNALIMDKEDDWDHKQLSFSGLAETMEGIRMQVASDMRMPITKLFGTSASQGIGNTDQNDMENYNAMVESQVRNKIKFNILRVIELKCQKLFGFIPDDLEIEFKPLRVLNAEQEENVKTQQFNRLLAARQAGEIDSLKFLEGCNAGKLLPIQLDPEDDLMNPSDLDDAAEGDTDPYDSKDIDDPGANREESRKPGPWEIGGIPKEPKTPKTLNTNIKLENAKMCLNYRGYKVKLIHDGNGMYGIHVPGVKNEHFGYCKENQSHLGFEEGKKAIDSYLDSANSYIPLNDPQEQKAGSEDHTFKNPGKVDEGLWEKAKRECEHSEGKIIWAVVTHIYKKMGGTFS